MLGDALKLGINSNVLDQNMTSIKFPPGVWCNLFNTTKKCTTNSGNTTISTSQSTKADEFYLHLRDGYIVPMQDAFLLKVNTTADLQESPVDFHVLGQR